MALRGIDVSYAQGNINWSAVRADGVEFAMIKATQGHALSSKSYLFTDRQFAANITGAHNVGIQTGVYHYLTAKSTKEAVVEAEHFCETIAPYKAYISLWAAVDVEEDKYLPRNKTTLTAIVDAFCAYVAAEGYKPIVYTNPNYLKFRLNDISKHDLWLALWRDKALVPTSYKNMQIWQWGLDKVGGIGEVDGNLGFFETSAPSAMPDPPVKENALFKVGDAVKVKVGKNYVYGTTKKFTVWFRQYDVISVSGDRVVIGKGKSVTAAVAAENLKLA